MKKFKPGQAIVFEPSWAAIKTKRAKVYKGHPLKYGDRVLFIAHITPAYGHCVIATYQGKVITMLHTDDFRAATEDEV